MSETYVYCPFLKDGYCFAYSTNNPTKLKTRRKLVRALCMSAIESWRLCDRFQVNINFYQIMLKIPEEKIISDLRNMKRFFQIPKAIGEKQP